MRILILAVISLMSLAFSCEKDIISHEEPLAEVYGEKLYQSDIDYILKTATSPEDSIIKSNTTINNWINEQLLLYVAEDNLPNMDDINLLVNKYKNDLVLTYYKDAILQERLDTLVSEEEIDSLYQQNRDQFVLSKNLVKVNWMRLTEDDPNKRNIKKLFYSEDYSEEDITQLVEYGNARSSTYHFEDHWVSLDELNGEIEGYDFNYSDIKEKTYSHSVDSIYYLVRILDKKREGSSSPKEFVSNIIKTQILVKRKEELFSTLQLELREREEKKKNVKIYN